MVLLKTLGDLAEHVGFDTNGLEFMISCWDGDDTITDISCGGTYDIPTELMGCDLMDFTVYNNIVMVDINKGV